MLFAVQIKLILITSHCNRPDVRCMYKTDMDMSVETHYQTIMNDLP